MTVIKGHPDGTTNDLAHASTLGAVEALIERYVVLSSAQRCAIALWVAHAHALDAADVTQYLSVTAAERECGKTRLLEVLELMVPGPLRAANISDAALFRTVDAERTTLLLDEVDALFSPRNDREDLRALLNTGYRRGAFVVRCETEGKKITPRRYDAFGAKALAGIGRLPDTIADRSIPIRMQRKTRDEVVERFRHRDVIERGACVREALEGWLGDAATIDLLKEARPDLPEALTDRQQDGWEPLVAIAELAGGEWPARARRAAVELHAPRRNGDESNGPLLLRHIRDAFDNAQTTHLSTADLLRDLCNREEGPWPGWWGHDVEFARTNGPASKLARLLRRYDIGPHNIGPKTERLKGYQRIDFEDVWSRYVPSPPVDGE